MIVLIFILIIIYISNNINKKQYVNKNLITIFIVTLAILLINIIIDLVKKRGISIEFNLDIISIAAISFFLCVCIKNKNDFLFLMKSIAILSIILASLNFLLWANDRVILLTQLTSNRIILFGLGAATLLFIENLKLENFLLIIALSFFATCGSLKAGLLAFGLFLFLSITMLIVIGKFKTAKLFFVVVALGVYIGYSNNNFQDIKSRINVAVEKDPKYNANEVNNQLLSAIRLGPLTPIDEYLISQCRESINYDYCISDLYTFRDSSERIRMWSHAIHIIRSNPFFGVGADGYNLRLAYRYASGNNIYDYKYPHNIFLNLAVHFGLPFTLLIGLVIYLCFVIAARVSILKPEVIGLVAAGAAIFLAANTGGNLYDARYIFFMFVLARLYCPASNHQRLESELVKL